MSIKSQKVLFIVVLTFSLLGLLSSFVLSIETIELARNENKALPCDINALFSCASVMKSSRAKTFGIPNPFLGLVGYSFMATMAFVYLIQGKLSKILGQAMFWGGAFAFVFSYWLIFSSIFALGVLCPYCLVSCFCATNIFIALLIYNLKINNFGFSKDLDNKMQKFVDHGWYFPVIGIWYFTIIAIIIVKFSN